MPLPKQLLLLAALASTGSNISCKLTDAQGSSTSAAPLRASNCGIPGQETRANPAHCEGPFYLDGRFNLRADVLRNYYKYYFFDENDIPQYQHREPSVPAHRFGSFNLKVPGINFDGVNARDITALISCIKSRNRSQCLKEIALDRLRRNGLRDLVSRSTNKKKYIRDLHYHLGNYNFTGDDIELLRDRSNQQRIGMRLIPVVDRPADPYQDAYFEYDALRYTIPSVDGGDTGVEIQGSEEVDKLLRLSYGYSSDQDIDLFAIAAYSHPEQHVGSSIDVLSKKHFYKLELGLSHLGTYIGQGMTRNSPYMYNNQKWWGPKNKHYPVHLYTVELKGNRADEPNGEARDVPHEREHEDDVSAETMNTNFILTLDILNEFGDGVVFPDDYKFDDFKAINLAETLAFYRAWVDRTWKRPVSDDPIWEGKDDLNYSYEGEFYYSVDELREMALLFKQASTRGTENTSEAQISSFNRDQLVDFLFAYQADAPYYIWLTQKDNYRTYCAEHVTIVTNVALNLPQNERGYKGIWGEEEGAKLWALAQRRYNQHFLDCQETANENCDEGFAEVEYFKPLYMRHGITNPTEMREFGKSLAWPIQTLPDLTANIVENYFNFTDKGMSAYYSAGMLVLMMPEIVRRMRITPEEYYRRAVPTIALMLKHHFTLKRHRILEGWTFEFAQRRALKAHISGMMKLLLWAEVSVIKMMVPRLAKAQYGQEGLDQIEWFTRENLKDKIVDPVINILLRERNVEWLLGKLDGNVTPTTAWRSFTDEMKGVMRSAREEEGGTNTDLPGPNKSVIYYSPPAVLHKITSNMHPHDPYVKIREVGTVMGADELCYTGNRQTRYNLVGGVQESGCR